ncbi:MAG: small, acid-soluble spore protein, alpha/beta type [Firmicutes bacterium]|nr:small, acid-soluble spore protein, alpha/beta type [Bacillota bacterium]
MNMSKGKNDFLLSEDDRMKYEIAQEIGLGDKVAELGWKGLTSRESGKIGGLVAAKKRKQKK